MWMKLRKIASPRNVVVCLSTLAAFSLFYAILNWEYHAPIVQYSEDDQVPPGPMFNMERWVPSPYQHDHLLMKPPNGLQSRQKALIFLRDMQSVLGRGIIVTLEAVRFKFQVQGGEIRSFPGLIDNNKGRYAVVIFEDLYMYLNLQSQNRANLDQYCRDFNVGIVFLLHYRKKPEDNPMAINEVGSFPLRFMSSVRLKDYEINATSPLLRITRPGSVVPVPSPNDWTIFLPYHHTYTAVTLASRLKPPKLRKTKRRPNKKSKNIPGLPSDVLEGEIEIDEDIDNQEKLIPVLLDQGLYDGIQRVFFGNNLKFWLQKVLFLDALSYLSYGRLSLPLERYFQIDIDDIFVGVAESRLLVNDVQALLNFQTELRKNVPGFTYQLGFSGKFIYSGTDEESEGDRMLLKLADNFSWFPHMWSHMQAHWFSNASKLCEYMDINRQFALRHSLNTSSNYAVAPHHAGVYPVHQQLYHCWRKVWNITSTSSEEYPNLRPDHRRKGFIYRNIMVIPRQTCSLFTHTMVLDMYPGGKEVLLESIDGGSLFQSFLYNQVNVFMTHQSNYGNDRLGLFTFDRAMKFLYKWTNLRLVYEPPVVLGKRYFNLYPEEVEPVWSNPCLNRRHLEIWSEEKNCSSFPKFVVVGPQKTGTTALYWFLNMHPHVKSNLPSPTTFEEVQFFSGPNYFKGIDWYMSFFPTPENNTVLFEKSATYFDQKVVPKRLKTLLPSKHIVVIFIDPALRAYSWYQHMRSHHDAFALKYTFYETITAHRGVDPDGLISLQRRCLDPGFYVNHLENWLDFIQPQFIIIVDGDMLKTDPAAAMFQLQKSLGFTEIYQYNKILKFDERKGFFCQVQPKGKSKCLGQSKGRKYPEMEDESWKYLTKYYEEANLKLFKLLERLKKPIPEWLKKKSKS